MDKKTQLQQELEETRAAYHALLAQIPEDGWQRPSPNPVWNVRQMMFHIAVALQFLPGDVAVMRHDWQVKPPMWLFNPLNELYTRWGARIVAGRQPRQSLAAHYDKQHAAVLRLLQTIEPHEWALSSSYPDVNENLRGEQTLADIFHYLTRHFHEHAADVRAALAGPPVTARPPQPPTGIGRLLFRAPITLYRVGLGWLLGRRFLLLHHVGRKSGRSRQAVLEVAGYDAATDRHTVAAGFGKGSQWYRNLQAQPEVTIQVGRRRLAVTAVPLSPEASGERMVAYARQHPQAAQSLMRLIGYETDGSDEAYRTLGQEHIPFVDFQRREELEPVSPLPAVVAGAGGLALLAGLIWRRGRRER